MRKNTAKALANNAAVKSAPVAKSAPAATPAPVANTDTAMAALLAHYQTLSDGKKAALTKEMKAAGLPIFRSVKPLLEDSFTADSDYSKMTPAEKAQYTKWRAKRGLAPIAVAKEPSILVKLGLVKA